MNGICAGGTGSFIDQMASLLQTDAAGLNEYAKHYQSLYNIAARCGVFAKSDIQPLINEGATREDLAASIFQAVVNQTISGLACGKPIRGHVAFLGGPLHFLSELKAAFIRTLKLDAAHTIDLENSHLFAAIGSALNAKEKKSDEEEQTNDVGVDAKPRRDAGAYAPDYRVVGVTVEAHAIALLFGGFLRVGFGVSCLLALLLLVDVLRFSKDADDFGDGFRGNRAAAVALPFGN